MTRRSRPSSASKLMSTTRSSYNSYLQPGAGANRRIKNPIFKITINIIRNLLKKYLFPPYAEQVHCCINRSQVCPPSWSPWCLWFPPHLTSPRSHRTSFCRWSAGRNEHMMKMKMKITCLILWSDMRYHAALGDVISFSRMSNSTINTQALIFDHLSYSYYIINVKAARTS